MAAVGVGRPEVIDIEERERHLAALTSGTRQLELEHAPDGPLIGQPGQRVGVGHALEPLGSLGGGRPQARPIDDEGRERGDRLEHLAFGGVRGVRRRPRDPERPEGDLDAAGRRQEREVAAHVGKTDRRDAGPIEGRGPPGRGLGERIGRVRCSSPDPRQGSLVHAGRRRDIQPGTIRILYEDRAHGRMQAGCDSVEQCGQCRIHVHA